MKSRRARSAREARDRRRESEGRGRERRALLSLAPRGLVARSRVLVRLASLAQIGELARSYRSPEMESLLAA